MQGAPVVGCPVSDSALGDALASKASAVAGISIPCDVASVVPEIAFVQDRSLVGISTADHGVQNRHGESMEQLFSHAAFSG